MVIAPDIEAQILRYHHAEKWTVGTIARQLHVHHSVVRRVLAQAGLPRIGPPPRPSQDRRLSALHPPDVGDVPDADGQPPPCDGARAWLSRQPRPFPPPDRLPSAATESRSLSASAQPAWRTSAGGLGPLWPPPDRPSAAAVDGVRDGAELLAPDLSALLPGRPNGELPARPCRRLRRVAWRSACSPL